MSKKRRTQLDIFDECFNRRMDELLDGVNNGRWNCEWTTEFDRKRQHSTAIAIANIVEEATMEAILGTYQPLFASFTGVVNDQSWVKAFELPRPKRSLKKLKSDPRLPSHYQKQKVYWTGWDQW